jgi:hypothetical protein
MSLGARSVMPIGSPIPITLANVPIPASGS